MIFLVLMIPANLREWATQAAGLSQSLKSLKPQSLHTNNEDHQHLWDDCFWVEDFCKPVRVGDTSCWFKPELEELEEVEELEEAETCDRTDVLFIPRADEKLSVLLVVDLGFFLGLPLLFRSPIFATFDNQG
jgi:hypothetical protein